MLSSLLFPMIITVIGVLLISGACVAIGAKRFTRVGPNQVLIVSGRKHQLPDGTRVGFRFVKGGGTIVLPVIEQAAVISLEVRPIDIRRARIQTKEGPAEVDCAAQVKIRGDDTAIIAAAEHFLSKSEDEVKKIVRPVLENHLRTALANLDLRELDQNCEACSARVQTAAATDLAAMGLTMISFTILKVYPG